ncbi:MAG: IS200/IS605 family transposase [Balneolaceae bacterium]
MANTYHKIYIHTIFAVKFRKGVINPEWEDKLHSVIGNLINESGGKAIITNGMEDHIHCFFHAKPAIAISDTMKSVKAKSSKWINKHKLLRHRFQWQKGFGCFSYGHSQKNDVYQYILNQKEHHKKMSFQQEYEKLLKMFEIEYDEQFLFKELE